MLFLATSYDPFNLLIEHRFLQLEQHNWSYILVMKITNDWNWFEIWYWLHCSCLIMCRIPWSYPGAIWTITHFTQSTGTSDGRLCSLTFIHLMITAQTMCTDWPSRLHKTETDKESEREREIRPWDLLTHTPKFSHCWPSLIHVSFPIEITCWMYMCVCVGMSLSDRACCTTSCPGPCHF